MAYDSNKGAAKLAQVLQNRMEHVVDQPVTLDFGTINDDLSLSCNQFGKPIPVSDYQVVENWWGYDIKTHDPNPAHIEGPHGEGWQSEEKMWWTPYLKRGDRVLVAWVGAEAVVLGRLKNAEDCWFDE